MLAMDKEYFLKSIKAIRKSKNITQSDLEQRTGIRQQVLSKMEQINSNPQLDTLITVANAMNCSIVFIDNEDSDTIRLIADRDWLNARKEYEKKKKDLKKEFLELGDKLAKNPNDKSAIKYRNECRHEIMNLNRFLKNITVEQFLKNIKDNDDINEFENLINEINEIPDSINEYKYICFDVLECIEACRYLVNIFKHKKNVIEPCILKELCGDIRFHIGEVQDLWDTLYYLDGYMKQMEEYLDEI